MAERRTSFGLDTSWLERARLGPVTPRLGRGDILAALARYDFHAARSLDELVPEVTALLEQGLVHPTHPRYFGLFNPSVRVAGVVGDALAALYNPQLGAWWHSPAATEIERHVLGWFESKLGLRAPERFACFTSGGSEANTMALLVALAHAFPEVIEHGTRALPAAPVLYVSEQAHDSFLKAARSAGLGTRALRRIPSDDRQQLRVDALAAAIAADRAAGLAPFLVVGTLGTTASGAIDPLPQLAELCGDERLWFHVDAAWGGLAALTPALRHLLDGLESADSATCDAHKVLPVPMGAGMFFCRTRPAVQAAFDVTAGYVPVSEPDAVDAYRHSPAWSRRFIGLKVFLTIAELGEAGVAALVDHQLAMTRLLAAEVTAAGFAVKSSTPLPLVCFTRPGLDPDRTARAVAASGEAWCSEVRLPDGQRWLRACITNHETGPEDVRALVAAVAPP